MIFIDLDGVICSCFVRSLSICELTSAVSCGSAHVRERAPSFCTCAVMSVLIRYLVTDIFHSCRLCHFDMDFDAVLRALTNLAENSIELVCIVVVVPH